MTRPGITFTGHPRKRCQAGRGQLMSRRARDRRYHVRASSRNVFFALHQGWPVVIAGNPQDFLLPLQLLPSPPPREPGLFWPDRPSESGSHDNLPRLWGAFARACTRNAHLPNYTRFLFAMLLLWANYAIIITKLIARLAGLLPKRAKGVHRGVPGKTTSANLCFAQFPSAHDPHSHRLTWFTLRVIDRI